MMGIIIKTKINLNMCNFTLFHLVDNLDTTEESGSNVQPALSLDYLCQLMASAFVLSKRQ